MTSRSLVPVEPETLERIAEGTGLSIELAKDRAYLTVGGTTFVADLPPADTSQPTGYVAPTMGAAS